MTGPTTGQPDHSRRGGRLMVERADEPARLVADFVTHPQAEPGVESGTGPGSTAAGNEGAASRG